MATQRDIKRRINSVQNTRQITRAMKLVAAAKLRRAQERAEEARPYVSNLVRMVNSVLARNEELTHPFLDQEIPEEEAAHVVVLAADRGLCGGYNSNVLREAQTLIDEELKPKPLQITTIGRKAAQYFGKREYKIVNRHDHFLDDFSYDAALSLASMLREAFVENIFGEAWLVYTQFKSALNQEPQRVRLLPFELPEQADNGPEIEHLLDPPTRDVIFGLFDRFLAVQIYRAGVEAYASEQGARMTAMENATNNATDMIEQLTLTYNRVRQAAITTEIIEIASAADAVKEST